MNKIDLNRAYEIILRPDGTIEIIRLTDYSVVYRKRWASSESLKDNLDQAYETWVGLSTGKADWDNANAF